jgi:hypothetical protein
MGLFDSSESGASVSPLEAVRAYLTLAIQLGAPAYNQGDHRGCYEVYACTARLLLKAVQGADEAKDVLRHALQQAATVPDVGQQAWILRHAFDSVLGKDSN